MGIVRYVSRRHIGVEEVERFFLLGGEFSFRYIEALPGGAERLGTGIEHGVHFPAEGFVRNEMWPAAPGRQQKDGYGEDHPEEAVFHGVIDYFPARYENNP